VESSPNPVARPGVDIVVPFRGSDGELEELLGTLTAVKLSPGDSLVVVDNGPASSLRGERGLGSRRSVIVQTGVPSSYYARNRGAERGEAEWILFVDADVRPPADLLERYFDPLPNDGDGVLAGAVVDEVLEEPGWRRPAARYAHLQAVMSQDNTVGDQRWSYAQTANCAVRRVAFEEVGGFTEDVRSGGDADLCFRLRSAGWSLERRDAAQVTHRARRTLRAMLRQRARHGSGARWLNTVYPGAFPRKFTLGWVPWTLRQSAAVVAAVLRRDGDRAILLGVELLSSWAFELGRLAPNHVGRVSAQAR
jgi:GT2 family glycosyltransferase